MRVWLLACIAASACSGEDVGSGPPSPLRANEAARACIAASACLLEDLESCLASLENVEVTVSARRLSQLRCLAASRGDCDLAGACIGMSIKTGCSGSPHCTGDAWSYCANATSFEFTVSCAGGLWYTPDSTCVNDLGCGLGPCPDETAPPSCDGTRILSCSSGVQRAFDCAATGEACLIDATIGARCGIEGALTCLGVSCDGNVLVSCDTHQHRTNCPGLLLGGTCQQPPTGNAHCGYGDGTTCSIGAGTCDGDVLDLCVLGSPQRLDCIELGYESCIAGRCVPFVFP